MIERNYKIVLSYDRKEKVYNVTVPSLPGCFTYGATHAEALQNAKEAIAGYLDVLVEDGEAIPDGDEEILALSISHA